jgi:hypothetical protein
MSKQLFETLLAKLKRAGQDRKLKLATEAGYSTVVSYKEYLEGMIDVTVATEPIVYENITDMVIAFDTTGSMSSYVKAVKNHVTELIPQLFSDNPGLNLSIVAFGDYCDMRGVNDFGKAYQVIDLTDDIDALTTFITNSQNTHGGDSDEFYELVIQKINNETTWRPGTSKSVLFIGDANPHKVGYKHRNIPQGNMIDWKVEAERANALGIVYDTLTISRRTTFYSELSQTTGGICLPFNNSSRTNDLVRGSAAARGGTRSAAAFNSLSMAAEASGDTEMTKVYSMYKSVIKK